MPLLPPPIEDFRIALADVRPQARVKAEPPFHAGNGWWLDVEGLPIVYREGRGFGFFAPEADEPCLWIAVAAEAAHAVAARVPAARVA